jgi:mitochondrial cardiolipin hydrolase
MDQIIRYFASNFGQSFSTHLDSEIADLINGLNRLELVDLRHRLFNEARKLESIHETQKAIFWLQNCFDTIDFNMFRFHRVYFSPGTEILDNISELLNRANKTLDICVFTITDERLASDLVKCHERGVKIRIVTDDKKIYDRGSAIYNLKNIGIPVKIDHSQYHMHHKFAIIDSRIAFTGSFNWTYTASKHNQENLLVTSNYEILNQYADEFERLWNEMYWL